MRRSNRLPARMPPGSTYVLERRGDLVHRWVRLPDGTVVPLPPRPALTCTCLEETSLVPGEIVPPVPPPVRRRARAKVRA